MTHRVVCALGLGSALAILGCSGLMGYGDELGDAEVRPGKAFSAPFQASSEDGSGHTVWLTYDVSHTQNYSLTGTFELVRGGRTDTSWSMNLKADGAPVQGAGARISINRRATNMNGKGSVSETVRLVGLPELKKGEKAKIVGTFNPGPGTTINSARVVITD